MTAFLGAPPPQYIIPVTLGGDFTFTLVREDSDSNPVDWDGVLTMTVDIVKTQPAPILAAVTGNQAVFYIPSGMCDQTHSNSTIWQIVFADPDTGTNVPVAVGYFARYDGSAM
jgi:hypothetical protein